MEVSDANNVKVYNLSRGKSLPEWLTDRKRRALVKKNIDIRKRIELLQDFTMPDLSNTVKVSKDGHYIMATGIYKPRIRCFEVDNLSMKFERCLDAEVVNFEILSDDYSKLVFLENERFVEFHAAGGTYYRLRIPKFGRDLKYHYPSCDLYIVAAGSDIYRLNIERGQFLNSLVTEATEVNRIAINPEHQLIVVGTKEGRIEAWDPRQRKRAGILDVALSAVTEDTVVEGFPSVTSLNFERALTLGVGTATGQVLLYDLRSDKPYLVKDHMYGFPIKDLTFHDDYVLSLDSAVLKIWNKQTGKMFTSVENGGDTKFNSLCHVPGSGLLFMANENPKILTYYIPQLGPAPKWCSFLDSLTEELEENKAEVIYDDYKFVTKQELDQLQLSHLIGTQLLKGYMHGYFMSLKLYNKAKSLVEPFNYETYKKKRVKEKMESERTSRINIKSLPKVNRELALKLMDEVNNPTLTTVKKKSKEKAAASATLLEDSRFKALFENPDFEIDGNAEEYRLLNPVLARLDSTRKKELERELQKQEAEEDEEMEGKASGDDSSIWSSDEDDERESFKKVKAEHKALAKEQRLAELAERRAPPKAKVLEIKDRAQTSSFLGSVRDTAVEESRIQLGQRLQSNQRDSIRPLHSGNREITFKVQKKKRGMDNESKRQHRDERMKLARKAPNTYKVPRHFFMHKKKGR